MNRGIMHKVTLSNGVVVGLEEGEDELHVCLIDRARGEPEYYICTLSIEGVQVMTNSGDACECIGRFLHAETILHQAAEGMP